MLANRVINTVCKRTDTRAPKRLRSLPQGDPALPQCTIRYGPAVSGAAGGKTRPGRGPSGPGAKIWRASAFPKALQALPQITGRGERPYGPRGTPSDAPALLHFVLTWRYSSFLLSCTSPGGCGPWGGVAWRGSRRTPPAALGHHRGVHHDPGQRPVRVLLHAAVPVAVP